MENKKDAFYIGHDLVHDTDWAKTRRNNNIVVCGSAGSGKTLCFTEPRLLQAFDSNLIVTVTKKRIIDKYRPVLEERGYRVTHMDFCDLESSDVCFDPMRYISSEADIRNLASAIYYSDPMNLKTTDGYWPNIAITLLQAEIALVYEALGGDGKFSDVIDLNNAIAKTFCASENGDTFSSAGDMVFKRIDRQNRASFAVDNWKKFSVLPPRTAGCALSSLGAVMDQVFSGQLRDAIEKKECVDLDSFAREKSVLFISTSPVNTSMHNFVNIFYSQAIKSFFELAEKSGGRLPIPLQMICDDFATGGKIHDFEEYISIFREADISVMIMLQSESQLGEIYGPDNAATIINNCDTYVYLGGMDTKTMQSISLRMNLPYNDIACMKIGDEFVMRRGYTPVRVKQYDIFSDPEYKKITQAYEEKKRESLAESHAAISGKKNPLLTRKDWEDYIETDPGKRLKRLLESPAVIRSKKRHSPAEQPICFDTIDDSSAESASDGGSADSLPPDGDWFSENPFG